MLTQGYAARCTNLAAPVLLGLVSLVSLLLRRLGREPGGAGGRCDAAYARLGHPGVIARVGTHELIGLVGICGPVEQFVPGSGHPRCVSVTDR